MCSSDLGAYGDYSKARAVLAHPKDSLVAISGSHIGHSFALSPACRALARLFEQKRLAIVANAGSEPSVVLNKVAEGKGNYGFNAQSETYGDLVEMGVVDPTKVTRTALQNAASVAGLLLTTDASITELVEEKKGGPAGGGMPDMGGMGGMGGMDM